MKLTHKDYKAPAVVASPPVPDVKAAIIAFVGKGSERHEDIIRHVQESVAITNTDCKAQIDELALTADFTPKDVVVEPEELESK